MEITSMATPLVAVAFFLILYLSDYSLTIYAANLYKGGANQVIALEGSYELNPIFVSDVDQGRKFSPRFILLLALYSLIILAIWYLALVILSFPQLYRIALGALLLVQGPIHLRHLRNILVFRRAINGDGVTGRIEYSRSFSYVASAVELASFSALFFILALVASDWALAGGALTSASLGIRHSRLARKATQ